MTIKNSFSGSSDQVLTYEQLKRLSTHRYSAQGISVLEPYMQHFWCWIVELVPMWCAPNAITLLGLVVNAATTLVLILYCPAFVGEAPRWSYFLCAFGLFFYQTLDAIDGKQARRTESSSPLGELFDHGCDALSIVFVVMGTCISVQLGTHPQILFLECFATMFVYYTAHWQTYCSATLQFGRFDVTEAQLSVILVYLLTGLFGSSLWTVEIPMTGIPLKLVPAFVSICAALVACRNYFTVIFVRGGVGKNGSTVAGTSVLYPIVPIASLMTLAIVVAQNSPSQIFHRHPSIYVLTFGMAASKLSNKLVVAHMSRSEMPWLDSSFIGPALLSINIQTSTPLDEFYLLCFGLIFSTLDLLNYSVQVCRLICDYMSIYCFKISRPPAATARPPTIVQPQHTATSSLPSTGRLKLCTSAPGFGSCHGAEMFGGGVMGQYNSLFSQRFQQQEQKLEQLQEQLLQSRQQFISSFSSSFSKQVNN